ncbi:ABC transporter ATP-binding protein [Clostridium thermarum]|uniref:ABC transporter ATP-binding protein n=1 Tax=Clostridium thermarum TaxID=1716543 RepID=UPI00111D71AD|nr:ABC transporter ATP-binding protein [Clostridium thermarum]
MIEFISIGKSYKDKVILDNLKLTVEKGEMAVLIGPSGCGKTTTLKMINKLITPSSGKILMEGRDIAHEDTIELRRKIGYVIQQTGLFPHMTVEENIALVPNLKKWPEHKIKSRTMELLELVGMKPEDYLHRYPAELSGGQQQRIGVARAFAVNPEVILMDEPFSALDPITRTQLQDELFNLQQEMKKTIVFVTHDMDEALKLGDKVAIMKGGKLLQYDRPEVLLKNPAHGFAEEFIGKNRIWNQPEFIKAEDIMIKNPVITVATRTVLQGIETMKSNKVDSLLVVNRQGILEGIVTLKDLKKNSDRGLKIAEIMETNVISIDSQATIIEVMSKMQDQGIAYVPVTEKGGRLAGLITRSSLLSVLSSQYLDLEVNA